MPIGATIGAAVIGGGAALAGGAIQAGAAEKAATTQAAGADKALALQTRKYEESRADSLPWLEAGRTALQSYMGELGLSDEAKAGTFKSGFKETDGYKFAISEGEKGALNNLSALGMKNSGSALKALSRFRMGLAAQERDKYVDRLAGMALGGQQQASDNATRGSNFAVNAGQTINDQAAATASGYIGASDAWTGALGGVSRTAGNALGYLQPQFKTPLRLGYQTGV